MNTIDKANAAKRLRDNDDFKAIMALVEADIFAAFQATKIGDVVELENVQKLSHGFKLLKQRIDKYISEGAFEASKHESY